MAFDLVSVWDATMNLWHSMNKKRAKHVIQNFPDRFSYVSIPYHIKKRYIMSKKNETIKKQTTQAAFVKPKVKNAVKPKVKNFSDLVGEGLHVRLDEKIDETIYLVGLEPMESESYGDGYKIHFKELPNAKDTYTAACFGTYVVPSLDQLFNATDEGESITEDAPIKTTIRKAGRSYKFE